MRLDISEGAQHISIMKASDATVEMRIEGLIIDPTTQSPIVILREADSSNILPIWIGVCEANAIAVELEAVKTPRPMTHDLIMKLIAELGFTLDRIVINTLSEGVFFAELHLLGKAGEEQTIDSRPSDAMALALRAKKSILVAHEVLAEAQIAQTTHDEALKAILERLRPEDLGEYEM